MTETYDDLKKKILSEMTVDYSNNREEDPREGVRWINVD